MLKLMIYIKGTHTHIPTHMLTHIFTLQGRLKEVCARVYDLPSMNSDLITSMTSTTSTTSAAAAASAVTSSRESRLTSKCHKLRQLFTADQKALRVLQSRNEEYCELFIEISSFLGMSSILVFICLRTHRHLK